MLAIRARAVSQWNDLSLRGGTAKATRARFLLPVLTFDALALHRLRFPFGSNLISLPPLRLEEMALLDRRGRKIHCRESAGIWTPTDTKLGDTDAVPF